MLFWFYVLHSLSLLIIRAFIFQQSRATMIVLEKFAVHFFCHYCKSVGKVSLLNQMNQMKLEIVNEESLLVYNFKFHLIHSCVSSRPNHLKDNNLFKPTLGTPQFQTKNTPYYIITSIIRCMAETIIFTITSITQSISDMKTCSEQAYSIVIFLFFMSAHSAGIRPCAGGRIVSWEVESNIANGREIFCPFPLDLISLEIGTTALPSLPPVIPLLFSGALWMV